MIYDSSLSGKIFCTMKIGAGSKFARKIVEHKRFQTVFNSLLVLLLPTLTVFPASNQVFGQTQSPSEYPSVANLLPTEEVILTTKKTSRLPVVGRLSQGFTSYHPGVDIENGMGEDIYPFISGVISETGFQSGGYGNYVLIDHMNGYFSLYAHLNKIVVTKGDTVSQDAVIGTLGLTGRTTGSHLHVEIYENGIVVNPLFILPQLPTMASESANFIGGPQSLPSRRLILPISQQTPMYATESAIRAEDKREEFSKDEKAKQQLGILLPNALTAPNPKPALGLVGSTGNHQLPTLVQF